ncbi:Ubiquitin-activating enzyme E1-like [Homalodisca vitripennis]|nr:Ubiquitin-activating enzyme E1-like [Homalodisca vitripennis]
MTFLEPARWKRTLLLPFYNLGFVIQVALAVDTQKMTVKELEEAVLKKALNMVAPDVRLDDGTGSIIISSEEGETDHNNNKTLAEVGVSDQTVMMVDDFLQNYELVVVVSHK